MSGRVNRMHIVWFVFALGWLCSDACTAQTVEAVPVEPETEPVSVEMVLGWIERYRGIRPESAELLRQSLDRQADPATRLELALLELHAPLSPSAEVRGLERLNALIDGLDESQTADWITPLAARWLVQWQKQTQAIYALQQQADQHADRLERERRAHLATLEKLDALRSIERELEQRPATDETAQAQPQSAEDENDESEP